MSATPPGVVYRSFRMAEQMGARSEDLFRAMVERSLGQAVCQAMETGGPGARVTVSQVHDEYMIEVAK